jgi:capsular polysaccharide biosynthesis protein
VAKPFEIVDDFLLCEAREALPPLACSASDLSAVWSGVAGGAFRPAWWTPDFQIPGRPFVIFKAEDVFYAPDLGLVAKEDGRVSRLARQQAGYVDPELSRLAALWNQCGSAPTIDDASLVLPWGAARNYGHFILDGLVSVPHLQGPFVTPPLQPWQRQHFALLGTDMVELSGPLYRIRRAYYTSAFGQNMHNPNLHFLRLRTAQLQAAPPGAGGRIYVCRKGQKRPLLCEDDLAAELRGRGFVTIQPELLPVRDQIAAFASADIIVAPTGAALANCLYCRPGTRVIEILPRDMTRSTTAHKWVAYLCALTGSDWRPYFCENSEDDDAMPEIGGVRRAGFLSFDLDLQDMLAFVDSALALIPPTSRQ